MDDPTFREVSKEEFREIYFRLGVPSGWTAGHRRHSFEAEAEPGWKFMVEEPRRPEHDRMWIVSDARAKEHRLFFMTDRSTEDIFEWPGGV